MVFLILSERTMAQVLRTTWCKNSALIEVLNISYHRPETIAAVGWSNERFRQSREIWVCQNSILISKILRIRFIKYLKIFARVIIQCLKNHLLNCILVVNLILYGLRQAIMLFNLILQPNDWSATSLQQTRLPATITVGTGQKLFLAAAPVQHFLPASNPCFHWTEMCQTVNPTRSWRISLEQPINGHSSSVIFPQMEGIWSSRSSQPDIRTSPILSSPVSTGILLASWQLPHLRGRKSAPGVHQLCNLVVSREQVN